MTIRTGKFGQYIYYACNAKLTGGAGRCETRAIRRDGLDSIVPSVLMDRTLQRSAPQDAQRDRDLDRVRREKAEA